MVAFMVLFLLNCDCELEFRNVHLVSENRLISLPLALSEKAENHHVPFNTLTPLFFYFSIYALF